MSTPHGERMKLTHSLSARERRALTAKVSASQESVDKAVDDRVEAVREAWGRGVPLADLITVTGLGRAIIIKIIGDDYQS